MTAARVRLSHNRRLIRADQARVTPLTADRDRGSANLVTVPRAGNVSSDTRAGMRRRSKPEG